MPYYFSDNTPNVQPFVYFADQPTATPFAFEVLLPQVFVRQPTEPITEGPFTLEVRTPGSTVLPYRMAFAADSEVWTFTDAPIRTALQQSFIDEAIEDTVNKKSGRLVWLNTGSLVGDQAGMPHASHQHLWEAVFELFPDETDPVALKNRRITVGGLIKWRVALRPEDWLVHYRETTKKDIVSGDTIYASEYWIKSEGVVVTSTRPTPSKPNRTTLDDLLNKFSKR